MFPRYLSIDRTIFVGLVGTTLATSTSTLAPTITALTSTITSTTIPSESIASPYNGDGSLNGTDYFMNFTSTATTSNHYRTNDSTTDGDEPFKKDFAFDRTDVRVIFITMYTLVFCCCFFGEYNIRIDYFKCILVIRHSAFTIWICLEWNERRPIISIFLF